MVEAKTVLAVSLTVGKHQSWLRILGPTIEPVTKSCAVGGLIS